MFEFSPIQEAQFLMCLVAHAKVDGEVNYDDDEVREGLLRAYPNNNAIESKLYELCEDGIIYFEMIGDDGFKPFVMLRIQPKTHERLRDLVFKIEAERANLALRLSEILTFNPEVIARSMKDSARKIEEAQTAIRANKLLEPLDKPLSEISKNFQSVETVFSHYEEIYKNIIRPVQQEGRDGVRATVRWAMIGIALSVALPPLISNWGGIYYFVQAQFPLEQQNKNDQP